MILTEILEFRFSNDFDVSFFQKKEGGALQERRVDTTRVDNDELVEELIQNTNFQIDDAAESKCNLCYALCHHYT